MRNGNTFVRRGVQIPETLRTLLPDLPKME